LTFAVESEPGETVVLTESYQASDKSEPFAFAISDRAIYLPARKTFAVTNDPWYFRRVPLSEVRELSVTPLRSTGLMVLAVLMLAAGTLTTYWMMKPVLSGQGGEVRGIPIAILVGGMVLPFASRGRRGLRVSLTKGAFKWKPPHVLDGGSKKRIAALLDGILAGAKSVGIRTISP